MSTKDLSTYVLIFDGTNYKEWYDKLEAFAMAMKCDGPMTEDPPAAAADLAAFNIIDRQMRGMIHLHLGAMYQSHVGATAKETLMTLKTTFGTPGRVGALIEMHSMFQHRMKPNSNPVHEANNLIQCVAHLLTAGFALADGLIAMAILMALPSDWETLVLTLCSTLDDAGFTVAEITSQINREYMCRQASRGRSTISLQDRISERTSIAAEYGSGTTLVSHLTNVKPTVRPSYQGGGNQGKGKQPVREGQHNQYLRCVFQGCHRNHFPAEFCPIGRQRIFMTKEVNRSAANHRSFLLPLEDRIVTTMEDLDPVMAEAENEDEERVKAEGEELMSFLMSPSNITTNLIMKIFRIIRP